MSASNESEDSETEKWHQRRRKVGIGIGDDIGKVVVHPFTKAKKQLSNIKSKKALLPL